MSVVALTDPNMLSQLLPARCKLDGEPTLHVSMTYLTNIGWLAELGYNILMVECFLFLASKYWNGRNVLEIVVSVCKSDILGIAADICHRRVKRF